MDRIIKKKKWGLRKLAYLVGIVAILLLSLTGIKLLNKKSYKISEDKLTIKEVTEGEFLDIILIDGEVEPISSVLVNSPEGGSVEEIFVEDGSMVKKGTPLVKIGNPSLLLSYMNQETAIVEQINNLQNLKLSLEKDLRSMEESLIDIDYELEVNQRIFEVDTLLYDDGVIAKNNYIDSHKKYEYQIKKRDFLEENVSKSAAENKIQIARINKSIVMMERNLDLIHSNMAKMLVRAPVSGRISSFDPVIGESFDPQQTIAKIDVMKGFKVMGQVDEYYLSTVTPGLSAYFGFDGQNINLELKKVLPEIINGHFEIELDFVEAVPTAITTGLSLQIRLQLSEATNSIMIPRGGYFHSSGGQFVFVLNENNTASKRNIKIGRQNPTSFEVLDGIVPGERIITSSYEAYKTYSSLTIIK